MREKLILFFCCLLIYGCGKKPFDYRSKYIGDYSFVIHYNSYNPLDGSLDTIYSKEGKVDYGSSDNTVVVFFNETKNDEFIVYEDGTIGDFVLGEFETTSKINYSWYKAESPAAHSSCNVKGEKK